jgi:hypothetical protein
LTTGRLEKAVSLINQGDAPALTESSAVPFVFDGEILLRASDVGAVWRNLSINGFRLDSEGVMGTSRVDDTTYQVFSEADEMRIFFSKYVPSGSVLGTVQSGGKTYYLLLGRMSGGYPQLLGIAGI